MNREPRVLLAIPCYNCAPQIPRVLQELDDRTLERVTEAIVLDNQSTDGTIDAALNARNHPRLKILRNKSNYGLGGSFKLALFHAHRNGFEYVIVLHGDNQAKSREVNALLDKLKAMLEVDSDAPPAAILGSRFMRESKLDGYSKARELANRAFNLVFSAVLLHRVHDIGSGLNLYATRALPREFLARLPEHAAFDVDVLVKLLRGRERVEFLPISWSNVDQVSTVRNFEIGALVLKHLAGFGEKGRLGESDLMTEVVNR